MTFSAEEHQYIADMLRWPNMDCSTASLKLEVAFGQMTEAQAVEHTEHRNFVNGILEKLGISPIP